MNKIIIIILSIAAGAAIIFAAINVSKNSNSDSSSKTVSANELSDANGQNGNPCYVALDGKVYEVKQGNKWQNGEHIPSEGQAQCGKDMSDVIGKSPHGKSILSLLTEVGTLSQ